MKTFVDAHLRQTYIMISFSFKSADKTGKSEVDFIEENKVWAFVKRPSDKSFKQGKSSKLNEMLTMSQRKTQLDS
jgi:hypothetical protein